MKVNFNKPLLNLDGSESGEMLNKLLSNILAQANEGVTEPIKFFDWAIKIFNDGEVELDNTDSEVLKSFIKNHKQLTVFAKGRLLEVFKAND
ncbi:hypothetical protein [Pedobacter sp.]|uniref:hypothetical protein n=1 Tax=Pedobacter sp. TaxID=1411316 RepID=UPI0031D2AE6D